MSMSFSDHSPNKGRDGATPVRNNLDMNTPSMHKSPRKMNLSRTDGTPKVNLVDSTPMSNKTLSDAGLKQQFNTFAQKINNLNTIPIMEENEDPYDNRGLKNTAGFIEVSKRRNAMNREAQQEKAERQAAIARIDKNRYWPNMDLHGSDYINQLLLYIPEDVQCMDRGNGKDGQFKSFVQLSKSLKNSHAKFYEDVVSGQSFNATSPVNLEYSEERFLTEGSSAKKMTSVKKVLELNKLQKQYYQQALNKEKKGVVLPLIKQAKDEHKKTVTMPQVKVLPSKKMYQSITLADMLAESRAFPDQVIGASSSAGVGFYGSGKGDYSTMTKGTEGDEEPAPIVLFSYKFFWNFNSQVNKSLWKPGAREGHTLTTVGKYLVLYGGISTCLLSDTAIYDTSKNMWTQPNLIGEVPNTGRHGHTAVEYKKSLIVFGGELQFNPTLNFRECINDTRMFTPERNEWKFLKPSSHPIPARRYHAAAVFGREMYVYGGIVNEGNFVKDVWTFNLKNYSWNQVEVEGDKENGMAFHQMVPCFVDRSNTNINNKEKPKITEEGLYVFGGKDTEGKYPNTLKVLPVGNKDYKWKYIQTKGSVPVGRINFSMMFYEPLGIIILYGGRNDTLYSSTNDFCLNDIRIFNLDQMAWSPTTSFGDMPTIGRYHHQAAYFGTKMFIFGGVTTQTFADDELRTVELNQAEVKRQIKMQADYYAQEEVGTRSKTIETKSPLQMCKVSSLPPMRSVLNETQIDSAKLRSKNFISFQPLPLSKLLTDQPEINSSGKKKDDPLKGKAKNQLGKIVGK